MWMLMANRDLSIGDARLAADDCRLHKSSIFTWSFVDDARLIRDDYLTIITKNALFMAILGIFFHWYLCRNRYKVCVEYENVMKSTQKNTFLCMSRSSVSAMIFLLYCWDNGILTCRILMLIVLILLIELLKSNIVLVLAWIIGNSPLVCTT